MKSTGIIRRVDDLGRVVIPKEIRDLFGIQIKGFIELWIEGKSIIIQKYEESCCFCNSKDNLKEFKEKLICKDCLEKIQKINERN